MPAVVDLVFPDDFPEIIPDENTVFLASFYGQKGYVKASNFAPITEIINSGTVVTGNQTTTDAIIPGYAKGWTDGSGNMAGGIQLDGTFKFGASDTHISNTDTDTIGVLNVLNSATIVGLTATNPILTGGTYAPTELDIGVSAIQSATVPGFAKVWTDSSGQISMGIENSGKVDFARTDHVIAHIGTAFVDTLTISNNLTLAALTVTTLTVSTEIVSAGTATLQALNIGSQNVTDGMAIPGFAKVWTDASGYACAGITNSGIFIIGNAQINSLAAIAIASLTATTATISTLNMGGGAINNVATPILSTDAVNKGYVDTAVSGASAVSINTIDVVSHLVAADLVSLTVPVTYTNGGSIAVVGSIASGTIAVNMGLLTNSFDIVGSQPLSITGHIGHPIVLTVGTLGTWSSTILAISNSGTIQTVYMAGKGSSIAGSTLAATYTLGLQYTSSDVGKLITFGAQTPAVGFYSGTITAVSNHNTLTVNGTIGINSVSYPVQVNMGTDNYSALRSTASTYVPTGVDTFQVNGNYYLSKYPLKATRVHLRGAGSFFVAGGVDTSPTSHITYPVIPWNASTATPPSRETNATVGLARLHGLSTVKVAVIGASTATDDPATGGEQTSWVHQLIQRWVQENPGVTSPTNRRNFSMGGGGMASYAGFAALPGSADWHVQTLWCGNDTNEGDVHAFAPNLVIIEWSANDVAADSNIDDFLHLIATLDGWATPPAIMVVVDINYNLTSTNIDHGWFDSASRFVATWARVTERMSVNLRREFTKIRNGYDPIIDVMSHVVVPTTGALGNLVTTGYQGRGHEAGFTYAGTPAQFWSAAGNMFGCSAGGAGTNVYDYAPLLKVGYDPDGVFPGGIADTIFIQMDVGFDKPGMALPGATVPTVRGQFSITSGTNQLTYAPTASGPAGIFTSGMFPSGTIVTIPGAGSTSSATSVAQCIRAAPTTPWLGTVAGPLVAYAKYINSTTIQLFDDVGLTVARNAVTTLSSSVQIILLGSPRVYTAINGISTDSSASTNFRIWSYGMEVGLSWQSQGSKTFSSVAIKVTQNYSVFFVFNGATDIGIAGKLTFAQLAGTPGVYDFSMPTLLLNAPILLDEDLTGTSFGNASVEPFGGSGGNHPTAKIQQYVIPALDALSLHIP